MHKKIFRKFLHIEVKRQALFVIINHTARQSYSLHFKYFNRLMGYEYRLANHYKDIQVIDLIKINS